MNKNIRFEIMCVLQGDGDCPTVLSTDLTANDVADKLSDFIEDELGIDCAIVVMDADADEEINK